MALTEERLHTIRETSKGPSGPASRPDQERWTRFLPIAWLIGLPLALVLEPAPSSQTPDPWLAVVAGNVLLGALAMTFVGSWLRRRWAIGASLLASSIFTAGVVACPVTGHHAFGTWWIAQLAIAVGLLAVSGAAALRPSA